MARLNETTVVPSQKMRAQARGLTKFAFAATSYGQKLDRAGWVFIGFCVAGRSRITICFLAMIVGCANEFAQQDSRQPGAESATPGKPTPGKPPSVEPSEKVHRLESVTWNPILCELTWVVSTGIRAGSEYTPAEKQTYKITMDAAVMQTGSERRRFDMNEAENVHVLMNMVTRYTAESTIWWQNGEGERIEESGPVAGGEPKHRDRSEPRPTPSSVPGASRGERLQAP